MEVRTLNRSGRTRKRQEQSVRAPGPIVSDCLACPAASWPNEITARCRLSARAGITIITAVLAFTTACYRAPISTCASPRTAPMRLDAGTSVTRNVDSQNERNRTGVLLDSGGVYRLVGAGVWKDGNRIDWNSPKGYPLSAVPLAGRWVMWMVQPLRRARHAPWFALVGELSSRPRDFFVIGDLLPEFRPTANGELVAFANDVKHFNFNNQGCVTLTIDRLR
ncbi:MAG: hypothetical protein JWM41_897 [Gemmatimonadetes bacterium]|nr:hypothetical protein [Gemmatimonadota bacterium]